MPILPHRIRSAVARSALAAAVGGTALVSGWTGEHVAFAEEPRAERARALTEAGARAVALGKYDFAIHAFKQANTLAPHPPLLFAIAAAYRQKYALENNPYDLAQAVAFYRLYLQAAPSGERHADASAAVAGLEPRLAAAPVDPQTMSESAAREASVTRLAVLSPTLDGSVRVDGGPARPLPLFVVLSPGNHRLAIDAPGYIGKVLDIRIGGGTIQAVAVTLDPQPAVLVIDAPSGAAVSVDGKRAGVAPLDKPLKLGPGKRRVSFTKKGFVAREQEVELARGKTTKLSVDLDSTRQRKIAWVAMAAGGVGIAGGVALGVVSVVELRRARDLDRESERGFTPAQQRTYDDAISARDGFRVGSGVAGGLGLGLFLLGGALMVFDGPVDGATPERKSGSKPGVDVSAVPHLGPNLLGGTITVRF